jgi:DNA polymerase-3 subunit epsilon
MFAVVDVETTGLSAKKEKITEIAIFIHDGQKVVDSFSTLINPEKDIPYRITQLTGIDNAMVASAPKFFEVAKKIIELTEDHILVGHNVRFDYGFLQQEFAEFGYAFQRKTLCTVKTSRKLIPGQASYSLGKLTASLGLTHSNKHRAYGDAEATTELLAMLYQIDPLIGGEKGLQLPLSLDRKVIDSLPRKAGVYYFLNANDDIIYVGKSIDIHQRVIQHLNNYSTRRSVEMMNQISDISYYVTGGELSALLLESNDIKKLKPLFNRAQRRSLFNYGLFVKPDLEGYPHFAIEKTMPMSAPLTSFQSQQA